MVIPVLFEDESILVIDKPVGISVTDEIDQREGDSLTIRDWVKDRYNYTTISGGAEDEYEQRYGIVHRLDKETSGVLIIAKDKETFQYLKGLFKFRRIHKEYQVLVYGIIDDRKFEISAPVARNKNTGTTYNVDPEGRESITEFEVLDYITATPGDRETIKMTYLMAYPKTGRTHQIRVHLKALGNPVVNDHRYAQGSLLKLSAGISPRMMLHAKRIKFIDREGKSRTFESPVNILDLFDPETIHKDK